MLEERLKKDFRIESFQEKGGFVFPGGSTYKEKVIIPAWNLDVTSKSPI